ncbi:MAG: cellulase N-terminal Ig-like domain-containing protein [Bacteroidota bacterium]
MNASNRKGIYGLSVVLLVFALLFLSYLSEKKLSNTGENLKQNGILINQLGYRPDDEKTALIKAVQPDTFLIIDAATNVVVIKKKFNDRMEFDKATGDNLFTLDFSDLRKPGMYRITIPVLAETSYNFAVNNNVYNECAIKTLESFYYQRCGEEISNSTEWKHPICHIKHALFYDDPTEQMNISGGWHDAGDYNKFVPSTAVSAAFLLYAFESNPDFFMTAN